MKEIILCTHRREHRRRLTSRIVDHRPSHMLDLHPVNRVIIPPQAKPLLKIRGLRRTSILSCFDSSLRSHRKARQLRERGGADDDAAEDFVRDVRVEGDE